MVVKSGALILAALVVLAGCERAEQRLPGQRLDIRGAPVAPPINQTRAAGWPSATQTAEWSHRGANARHLMPHAALAPQPVLAWAAPIGQGNERRHRISADPVAASGRIFTLDSRAGVSATSTNGQPLWSRDLTAPGDNEDDAASGGLAVSGNRLFVATAFGRLHALDAATGATLWEQRIDAPVSGAPAVAGGQVYVATRDSRGWVLDAENGRLLWQTTGAPSAVGVTGGSGPSVDGTLAVFPFGSGQVTATFRRGGFPAWQSALTGGRLGQAYGRIADISSDPVLGGGRVYLGNPGGRMAALDANDGSRLWTANEGAVGPLAVIGGSVYAVSDQARLLRLDAASGATIWSAPLPQFVPTRTERRRRDVFAHFGPIPAGGRLWVASGDGVLRGFDPASGRLVGEIAMGAGAASHPIVVGQTLYVVTDDGQLRAFR